MRTALSVIQIVLSLLIVGAILLQSQGTGLGVSWQGGGEHYHTRRGVEKVVFYLTIVLLFLFAAVSLGMSVFM